MATRILVVDDEVSMCEYVQRMLSHNGCLAESARNANEALAKLNAQPFDLVLTDYLMRGLSGRQLAWVIKSLYPRLPVILVTGYFPSGPLEGIDCVLLKPFTPEQLWTVMGEIFMRALTKPETVSESKADVGSQPAAA